MPSHKFDAIVAEARERKALGKKPLRSVTHKDTASIMVAMRNGMRSAPAHEGMLAGSTFFTIDVENKERMVWPSYDESSRVKYKSPLDKTMSKFWASLHTNRVSDRHFEVLVDSLRNAIAVGDNTFLFTGTFTVVASMRTHLLKKWPHVFSSVVLTSCLTGNGPSHYHEIEVSLF